MADVIDLTDDVELASQSLNTEPSKRRRMDARTQDEEAAEGAKRNKEVKGAFGTITYLAPTSGGVLDDSILGRVDAIAQQCK